MKEKKQTSGKAGPAKWLGIIVVLIGIVTAAYFGYGAVTARGLGPSGYGRGNFTRPTAANAPTGTFNQSGFYATQARYSGGDRRFDLAMVFSGFLIALLGIILLQYGKLKMAHSG
jgi:hypothetical protein